MDRRKFAWRFDAEKISQSSSDAGYFFFALDPGSAHCLEFLADIVLWEKLWEQGEVSDSELELLQQRIYNQMSIPLDLSAKLDELIAAIEASGGSGFGGGPCGCGDSNVLDAPGGLFDGIDGILDEINWEPPAAMAPDTGEYSEYLDTLCANATALVDGLTSVVGVAKIGFGTFSAGLGLAGLVGSLLVGAGIVTIIAPATGLVAIAAAFGGLVSAVALDGVGDTIQSNRDQLVCDIYSATSVAAGKAAFNSRIDSLFSAPVATLLKSFIFDEVWNAIYSGTYGSEVLDASNVAADCSSCTDPRAGVVKIQALYQTTIDSLTYDGDMLIAEYSSGLAPSQCFQRHTTVIVLSDNLNADTLSDDCPTNSNDFIWDATGAFLEQIDVTPDLSQPPWGGDAFRVAKDDGNGNLQNQLLVNDEVTVSAGDYDGTVFISTQADFAHSVLLKLRPAGYTP